jgi:quercetin dioxygenase-like cupin family protein
MPMSTPKQFGKLQGIIYDFSEANDVLAMHSHDENTIHISVVSRGSFRVHNGGGWDITIKAGDVVDFEPNEQHEFIALEPNSRIVNIIKGVA